MKSIRSIIGDRDTVTVDVSTTVTDAARVMARRQIGAVGVTNDGRFAGIFSERDVLNRVVAAGRDPATLPVGDVMTSDLIVADVSESYEACLLRMTVSVSSKLQFQSEICNRTHPCQCTSHCIVERSTPSFASSYNGDISRSRVTTVISLFAT